MINKISENRPCRIYRLVDPRFYKKHRDYLRYVGWTIQNLDDCLSDHWEKRCDIGTEKETWLAKLDELDLKPEIELIEISERDSVKERVDYWRKRYCEMGYRLTGIPSREQERFPQFLSKDDLAKRERFLMETLGPAFAKCKKEGLECLLFERSVLRNFYEVEERLIADMLEVRLTENRQKIEEFLSRNQVTEPLAIRAKEAIERSLPDRPEFGTYYDFRSDLQKKAGLSQDASIQECLDVLTDTSLPESKSESESEREKSFFEKHREKEDERITAMEQEILDQIERGEVTGKDAEILREAIGTRGISNIENDEDGQQEKFSSHLDNLPAVKNYLELVEEKGEDWIIYYLGKEPSKDRKKEVEIQKQEAEGRGWHLRNIPLPIEEKDGDKVERE